jgi:hypothetical protein
LLKQSGAPEAGWIVQEVTVKIRLYNGKNEVTEQAFKPDQKTVADVCFYECWPIKKGATTSEEIVPELARMKLSQMLSQDAQTLTNAGMKDQAKPLATAGADLKNNKWKGTNDVFAQNGSAFDPTKYTTGTITIETRAWYVPGILPDVIKRPGRFTVAQGGSKNEINNVPNTGDLYNLQKFQTMNGRFLLKDGQNVLVPEAADVEKWLKQTFAAGTASNPLVKKVSFEWRAGEQTTVAPGSPTQSTTP